MSAKLKEKHTPVNENEETQMTERSAGRIVNIGINVILVLAIIVAACCTYVSYVSTSGNGVPSILGMRLFSIQTDSMYPEMSPGDLIIGSGIKDTSELEIGDIITYWTVIDGQRVLNTHRITQIYDGGGYLIFETKGDNNTAVDALTVHESEVVAQYNGVKLPGAGKVFDYLQTSTGFLLVVVIPVAIFFLFHLIQFFRVLFEYNNIKNKLLYEQERGKTENLLEEERKRQEAVKKAERERLEQELREKLRSEILAAKAETGPAGTADEDPSAMEARIRAEMEVEAARKAEEERKAAERAAMEAEIRAKILAEMEAGASGGAQEK